MVECPAISMPNKKALQKRLDEGGAVHARRGVSSSKALHLFIFAAAYTGSSAMAGLILTSPNATGLCTSQLCEGLWLLPDAQWGQRFNPLHRQNWERGFKIWDTVWDQSKAVRVEKSPESIIPGRIDDILSYVKTSGREVGFLFMSRSKCFGYRPLEGSKAYLQCHDQVSLLADALEKVKASGNRHHVVHYEDLMTDPYTQAQGIVDAFPELGSVDPAKDGMPHSVAVYALHGVARYALQFVSPPHARQEISEHEAKDASCLGYKF